MLLYLLYFFNQTSLLNHPVDEWDDIIEYNEAKELVKALQVFNDNSERPVKLYTDFMHKKKSEEKLLQVYRVIEKLNLFYVCPVQVVFVQ